MIRWFIKNCKKITRKRVERVIVFNMPERSWFPLESNQVSGSVMGVLEAEGLSMLHKCCALLFIMYPRSVSSLPYPFLMPHTCVNPQDVMNTYIQKMGVDTSNLKFCEVLSMEDWALEMVPQPCHGVIMLFPIKNASEEYNSAQSKRMAEEGQVVSPNLKWIKQNIGNACGTIGILHALSNLWDPDSLKVETGSYISKFMNETKAMNGEQIAAYLDSEEGGDELEEVHQEACAEGQTESPDENTSVDTHFVCFSLVDGHLYELDGRQDGPVNHGECTPESLLGNACNVVKGYMERDPGEVRFTIVALAAAPSEE